MNKIFSLAPVGAALCVAFGFAHAAPDITTETRPAGAAPRAGRTVTTSRPSPESFTPPYGMWSTRHGARVKPEEFAVKDPQAVHPKSALTTVD